jgi:enoyl-CoA hydratase
MGFETISIERVEGMAILKLNRPPVNVLSERLYLELYEALEELERDDATEALIVSASGEKAFSAGLDVKDVAGRDTKGILHFLWNVSRRSLTKLSCFNKPTVAAVFGLVLGGGLELVLCCDLRVGSEDAVLGFPEINLGIIPGSGGTVRLPRIVGMAKAKEMLLTGETITAEEALRAGLLTKVVQKERLMEEALSLAKKLASKPKVAFGLLKRSIETGIDLDVSSALTFELDSFAIAYSSEDGREGLRAFIEKRKPEFKGR